MIFCKKYKMADKPCYEVWWCTLPPDTTVVRLLDLRREVAEQSGVDGVVPSQHILHLALLRFDLQPAIEVSKELLFVLKV
jgi:hypothetical protein